MQKFQAVWGESQTKYGKAAPLWIGRELRSARFQLQYVKIIIISYNEKTPVRGCPAIWVVCSWHSPIRFRGEFSAFSKITWLFANSRPVVIWEKQQKPLTTIGCVFPATEETANYKICALKKKRKKKRMMSKQKNHFRRWIPSVSCWRASHPSGCLGPWPPFLWPPRQTAYRRN